MRPGLSIPTALINVFQPPAIMGLGATGGVTFMLQVTGSQTPQELEQALYRMLGILNDKKQSPQVAYAFSSFEASSPQLFLDLDRAKAEAMGIPVNRIFTALQSKLASYYINDFNIYGYSFKVKMQSEPDERSSLIDIDQIMVQNNAGADGPGVGGRDAAADRRPAPDRTLQPVDGGEDQRAGDGGVEQRRSHEPDPEDHGGGRVFPQGLQDQLGRYELPGTRQRG